jgi:flagellar assembly protein FliH
MKFLYDVISGQEGADPVSRDAEKYTFKALIPGGEQTEQPELAEDFEHIVEYSESKGEEGDGKSGDGMRSRAETLKERASAQAAEIVEEARRNAELIERQAYEKGYQQGEVAGQEIGRKQFESVIKSLESGHKELEKEKVKILRAMEPDVVALAMAIARKVVHGEIEVNPDVVIQNIRACIDQLANRDKVTVRVNPSDYSHVAAYKDNLAEDAAGVRSLAFEADPSIPRGGAKVETEFGEMDARIDQQLEQLEKTLKQTLQNGGAERR